MTHVNPAERPTIEDVVKFSFIRESQEPFKLSVCSNHVSHLFVVNRGLEQTGVHKPILSKYLLLARGINEAPLTQDPDGPTQGSSKLPTFCIAQWYGIISLCTTCSSRLSTEPITYTITIPIHGLLGSESSASNI